MQKKKRQPKMKDFSDPMVCEQEDRTRGSNHLQPISMELRTCIISLMAETSLPGALSWWCRIW